MSESKLLPLYDVSGGFLVLRGPLFSLDLPDLLHISWSYAECGPDCGRTGHQAISFVPCSRDLGSLDWEREVWTPVGSWGLVVSSGSCHLGDSRKQPKRPAQMGVWCLALSPLKHPLLLPPPSARCPTPGAAPSLTENSLPSCHLSFPPAAQPVGLLRQAELLTLSRGSCSLPPHPSQILSPLLSLQSIHWFSPCPSPMPTWHSVTCDHSSHSPSLSLLRVCGLYRRTLRKPRLKRI